MTGACPVCAGPLLAPHPADLVHQHDMACPLLAAEDSTRVADLDRLTERRGRRFDRPSTPTERTLVEAHWGGPVPEAARTLVQQVTGSVVHRSWWYVRPLLAPERAALLAAGHQVPDDATAVVDTGAAAGLLTWEGVDLVALLATDPATTTELTTGGTP